MSVEDLKERNSINIEDFSRMNGQFIQICSVGSELLWLSVCLAVCLSVCLAGRPLRPSALQFKQLLFILTCSSCGLRQCSKAGVCPATHTHPCHVQ